MSIDSISCADEAQKAEIIQLARAQFAQKGYKGVSWRGLAQQLNLSSGGLSYHFHSKVELAEACLQAVKDDLSIRIEGVIKDAATTSSNRLVKCGEVLQHCLHDANSYLMLIQMMLADESALRYSVKVIVRQLLEVFQDMGDYLPHSFLTRELMAVFLGTLLLHGTLNEPQNLAMFEQYFRHPHL